MFYKTNKNTFQNKKYTFQTNPLFVLKPFCLQIVICLDVFMSQIAVNSIGVGKKKDPSSPTVRLELELEKTSKDSFPEFSYLSLKKELNLNIDAAEKENRDTTNKTGKVRFPSKNCIYNVFKIVFCLNFLSKLFLPKIKSSLI